MASDSDSLILYTSRTINSCGSSGSSSRVSGTRTCNRSVSNEDGDTSSGRSSDTSTGVAGKCHSAGYDAYQTGCIFAKLLGKHGGAGVAKVTATTVIHFATNQTFL